MTNIAIKVDGVSKTFRLDQRKGFSAITSQKVPALKTLTALDEISFQIFKGEILGILGLNGSGKSTLLRIIAGIYQPDKGIKNSRLGIHENWIAHGLKGIPLRKFPLTN